METSPLEKTFFPIYNKRSGTVDYGKEYEYLMCAFFATKMCCSENITDFEITTNNEIYGDFDDIAVKITFKDDRSHLFLFQLKHSSNNKKNITEQDLCSEKGDFSLLKYYKSYKIIANNDTSYILFTNLSSVTDNEKMTLNSQKITVETVKSPTERMDIFNTSGKIFRFVDDTSQEMEEFFKNFYFFNGQKNAHQIRISLNELLKEIVWCDISDNFIAFMKDWWAGNFILTKRDVMIKLSELGLSSSIQSISQEKHTEKSKILEETIQKFEMTIVENLGEDLISKIWSKSDYDTGQINKIGRKYNLFKRKIQSVDELTSEERSKVFWYLDAVPLVVQVTESNKKAVKAGIELLHKNGRKQKVVLLGNGLTKSDFPGWEIFENLDDLQDEEVNKVMETFEVSVQGRKVIKLKEFIESNKNVRQIFGVRELLLMSQDVFSIGQNDNNLPEFYIPRKISATCFDIQKTLNYVRSNKSVVLVINSNEEFRKNVELNDAETIELNKHFGPPKNGDYNDNWWSKRIILSSQHKCTFAEFELIQRYKQGSCVFLVENLDYNLFLLLLSSNELDKIEELDNKQLVIDEKDIFSYFDDTAITALCAAPGMGKSTFLSALTLIAPPRHLSFVITLIHHSKIFKETHTNEEIWSYFLEILQNEDHFLTKMEMRNQKLYLFLDGLDEIDYEDVNTVFSFIRYIFSKGVCVWITSRFHLKDKITTDLNVIPINLEELKEEEQETYICNRLKSRYDNFQVKSIIKQIFRSTNIVNSQKVLGIPLQLYVITENFLNSFYSTEFDEQRFVLTRIYKEFFEGKKKHHYQKSGLDERQLGINFEIVLEQYEIPALKSCLDSEDFSKLNLELSKTKKFLQNIKSDGDKFGIISKIEEGDKIIFGHHTFGEYFTCVWLKDNLEMVRVLQNELFSDKYQNLKLMFDIMMAETSPLHLGVIYGDINQVIHYTGDFEARDGGRRNALHLICSYGKKIEFLRKQCITKNKNSQRKIRFFDVVEDTEDLPVFQRQSKSESANVGQKIVHIENDDLNYQRIFEHLLQICNPFEEDELFKWNSLEYAINSECLLAVELISQHYHSCMNLDNLFKIYSTDTIAFNASLSHYFFLLREVLTRSPNILSYRFGVNCSYLLHLVIMGSKDENFTPTSSWLKNSLPMIDLLIEKGQQINVSDFLGRTPLHLASKMGQLKNTKILLQYGADVNARTYKRQNALHLVKSSNTELSTLLITSGIDIHAQDCFGNTPLLIAAKRGDCANLKLFLEKGADITDISRHIETVLHHAIGGRNPDMEVVTYLINKGVDINYRDSDQLTPLHLSLKNENKNFVKILLENGAEVNITNSKNQNLLYFFTIWNVQTDLIKMLIDNGIDINLEDIYGMTPLHHAAQHCRYEIANLLIQMQADLNSSNNKRQTPLICAASAEEENSNLINLLIRSGAEVNSTDALECALQSIAHNDNIKVLYQHYKQQVNEDSRYCLHYAVYNGNCFAVNLFLEGGINLVKIDKYDSQYPLFYTAVNGKLQTQLLLKMTKFISTFLIKNSYESNVQHLLRWRLQLEYQVLYNHPHLMFDSDDESSED